MWPEEKMNLIFADGEQKHPPPRVFATLSLQLCYIAPPLVFESAHGSIPFKGAKRLRMPCVTKRTARPPPSCNTVHPPPPPPPSAGPWIFYLYYLLDIIRYALTQHTSIMGRRVATKIYTFRRTIDAHLLQTAMPSSYFPCPIKTYSYKVSCTIPCPPP